MCFITSKDVLTGLSSDEVKKISQIIQAFDIKQMMDTNSIGLFDLWLYTEINNLLGLHENYQTEIIDYLYQLQTEEGFFLTYIDEDPSNHLGTSYILPTKMALDIFETLDQPLSKVDESRIWFKNIFEQLSELGNHDPVTVGDYIGLLKEIDYIFYKMAGEKLLTDLQYSTLFNKIKKDLFDTKISIDNMYTLVYLKEFINDFEIENDFLSYTREVQLKDGSFPVFGVSGLESDIYTTYLFLWVFNEMELEIPNKEILSLLLARKIDSY